MSPGVPPRRRLFAPEIVQSSAMDCGPAALACLLEGHGIRASYGRLREACQTEVDGTSIDVLEDVANRLGLEVEQALVPIEHLLLDETGMLPALTVVEQPGGFTHFVVVWRRHGRWVQIMDPAAGRRFVRRERLERELLNHCQSFAEGDLRAWLESEDFRAGLAARLHALGAGRGQAARLIDEAIALPGVRGIATLEAAVRLGTALVRGRALAAGAEGARAVEALFRRALRDPNAIPHTYFAVLPDAPAPDAAPTDAPRARLRGAVALRVRGRRPLEAPVNVALPPELQAALAERPPRLLALLWRYLRAAGRPALLVGRERSERTRLLSVFKLPLLIVALVAASVGTLLEGLLLRSLFDMGRDLGVVPQRLGASALLLVWVGALALLELPLRGGVRGLGRLLEAQVRSAFLQKIPRLGDRYLSSRASSDMAERAHALHRLRQVTDLAAELLRTLAALAATTAGLVWLDRQGAAVAILAAGASVALPLLALPALREQDLRLRSHGAALGRFYLDALLGLVAVRSHSAERAVRREHEALLVEWARTGRAFFSTAALADAAQGLAGFALAALLLFGYLGRASETGGILLFVYWALTMPALGQELALKLRQVPGLRNVLLRVLEPLSAPEELTEPPPHRTTAAGAAHAGPEAAAPAPTGGVSIAFEGVRLVAGGHDVLSGVTLELGAGEHVAVVGASGAGKSSLVGLLLGWQRPTEGQLHIDGGVPLAGAALAGLRAATAWLDPAVHLWNRSLHDNLLYGVGANAPVAMDRVLAESDLLPVLERLPEGLASPLGEGGGLLSGGEGQRVRLGRALARPACRLVILDEPFRGLDRASRRELLRRVRERHRDATLICVTHDLEETLDFKRVLVIDGGRIVEDAPPERLAGEAGSRYRALIDHERVLRADLAGGTGWRRVYVSEGRLREPAVDRAAGEAA